MFSEGYYWVRTPGGDWEVAEFCSGQWWRTGSEVPVPEPLQIGPRIFQPEQ